MGDDTALKTTSDRTGSVSTFLQKVLAMVEEPESSNLVAWTPNGESFRVYDPVPFAKEVLPRFFKHCNFSSFVRQLNMYDFHKVMDVQQGALSAARSKEWEFVHPNFKRGQAQLLALVKRKAGSTEGAKPKGESLKRVMSEVQAMQEQQAVVAQKLEHLDTDNRIMWNEMVKLKSRHQQQQQTINRILYFLSSIYSSDNLPNQLRDTDDVLQLQGQGQNNGPGNQSNTPSLLQNTPSFNNTARNASMQQPNSYNNLAEQLMEYSNVGGNNNGGNMMNALGNSPGMGGGGSGGVGNRSGSGMGNNGMNNSSLGANMSMGGNNQGGNNNNPMLSANNSMNVNNSGMGNNNNGMAAVMRSGNNLGVNNSMSNNSGMGGNQGMGGNNFSGLQNDNVNYNMNNRGSINNPNSQNNLGNSQTGQRLSVGGGSGLGNDSKMSLAQQNSNMGQNNGGGLNGQNAQYGMGGGNNSMYNNNSPNLPYNDFQLSNMGMGEGQQQNR